MSYGRGYGGGGSRDYNRGSLKPKPVEAGKEYEVDVTEISRTRQGAVAIEVNPVDAAGSATKKRGIVIRSASELNEFNRILENQKLVELASKVDEVNPKQKETSTATASDVFQI
jgi:hypothetical protein